MTHKEQLKDPRWIKKSKKVKDRDNSRCQKCGIKSKLEVHHHRYLKFRLLWDYPDEYLITLCRDCHQQETDHLKMLDDKIESMLISGLFAKDVINKFNIEF